MKIHLACAVLISVALVTGCGRQTPGAAGWDETTAPAVAPQPRPDAGAAPARLAPTGARTAAAYDRTTPSERAAAVAAPVAGAVLGQIVVSLGNPAEPGFWLRSGLVTAARPGTVRLASGASVQVELRPLTGGGPQLSLAAYRALGLGLTDLPQVSVHGR